MSNNKTAIKRLVYTPKAYAFIYSRRDGKVVDVSNDITAGSVQRLINKPSKAKLVLRNDNWHYTGRFDPMFFPMDGITIWLQKFAMRPVQVFTGFIDSIPFYQAYPDKIEINATCTLKRAMYSYFDPGIGFIDWLGSHGWYPKPNSNYGAFFNDDVMDTEETLAQTEGGRADGGMGQILRSFLIEIGGYDPNSIVIGDLPNNLPKTMLAAYLKRVQASQAAENALLPALKRFLTVQAEQGDDAALATLDGAVPTGISSAAQIGDIKTLVGTIDRFLKSTSKPTMEQMILAGVVMSGLDKDWNSTDTKYPTYGRGYFAEPNVGTVDPAPDYYSTAKQGSRFCEKFSQLIPAPISSLSTDGGKAAADQVAEVLAYGYGKDKFYGQILESCRKPENIQAASQIANAIRQNQNIDFATLSAVSAGEVTAEQLPREITWAKLFDQTSPESGTPDIITSDGKIGDSKAVPISGQKYQTSFVTYLPGSDVITAPGFPTADGLALKHSEIKYYVYGIVTGTDGSGASKTILGKIDNTNLKAGSLLKLTSPSGDNKQVTCVFIGNAAIESPNAPLTISPDAISALGINKRTNGSITENITFELLTSSIPEAPVDPNKTSQDIKNAYVKTIEALVGSQPNQASSYSAINITAADREAYNKYYKNANNRLAEYFYIASSYNLHLMDKLPDTDQLLLYGNESGSPEQLVSFYKDIGILAPSSSSTSIVANSVAQSVPRGMRLSVNQGQTVTRFNFDGADVTTVVEPFDPGVIQSGNPYTLYLATSSINANTGNPSPIWNGAVARMPEDTAPDADAPAGADQQTLTWSDLARISTASAFSTLTNFPFDLVGSAFFIGEKSIMNDETLIRGVEEFCKGSMRHYMSLPNGQFCAFYPDFFGVFGRKPYLKIKDIEIIDLSVVISDEPIVTHMFVNGNTINPLQGGVDVMDKVLSVGVVTIDDVFQGKKGLNFINNPEAITGVDGVTVPNIQIENAAAPATYKQYYDDVDPKTIKFLETYGARRKVVNEPLIRSPWFEFVSAYNQFTYNWTMHTATNVQLTFMPELMTGGLVRFEDHNIIMYVEAVHHVWDYATGFETSAYLSAPSTDASDTSTPAVPGMALFNSAIGETE